MNFKACKIAAAAFATTLCALTTAHAGIVVNDWTLNLTGIDGLGTTVINGIDQIQFTGVAHTENTINDGSNVVGDTGRTRGLLAATSFLHNGGVIPLTGLNNNFELTFTFDVGNITTAVSGTNSNFTHAAGAAYGSTGLLNIYVDNFANGGSSASQQTGAGYSDGVLIATFMVDAGLGGVFNAATFNGSDDATFHYVSSLANVILDAPGGNDLGNKALVAVTSSQFDADFNNDGIPDVACPTNGVIGGVSTFSPTSFCAQEDGRASIATSAVPEPASLALVGAALAGLGLSIRKTRKQ